MKQGFVAGPGLLCVLDGAKGLRKAVLKALPGSDPALPVHKRENVCAICQGPAASFRQNSSGLTSSRSIKRDALGRIRQELQGLNESAVRSLDEGLEETLTLHRLGLFTKLGESLKTTNCIESLLAQVSQWTHKVDYWRNSFRSNAGRLLRFWRSNLV